MTDNYIPCTKTWDRNATERGATDFGLLDKRNRAIGYVWSITPVTTVAKTEEEKAARSYGYVCLPEDLGLRFELSIHVTRNSKTFGACNRGELFTTIEAARAAAQRKAADARKRYAAKPQEKR